MALEEETKKQSYLGAMQGESPSAVTTPTSEDYYKSLKEEKYRVLLDSEIQLANAKQNAMKATNNNMAALGMGGSGYGVIASSGIGNDYLNAMRGVRSDYDSSISNINQQQRTEQIAQENTDVNNISSAFDNATSESDLNKVLSGYGIELDENGNFTGEYWDSLSDNAKRVITTKYQSLLGQAQASDWLANNTVDGQAYKDSGVAIQEITDSNGNKGNTSHELRYIFSDEYMKNRNNGDVVKLVNGGNKNSYVYMVYYNGAWYKTTGEVYERTKANPGSNTAQEIRGK